MSLLAIREIQGEGLFSSLAGQQVETRGVVTGIIRKGFYIQTPEVVWDGKRSDAIFVFGDNRNVSVGYHVQVGGECVNFLKHELARPVTQIKMNSLLLVEEQGPSITPIEFSQATLPVANEQLAALLNSLEGMLMAIPAGATFIAPSNLFGDYVCALPHHFDEPGLIRTEEGGLIAAGEHHSRWFPGFRIQDYKYAPRVNVGATLKTAVVGPLHYRVEAWQIAASDEFTVDDNLIPLKKSALKSDAGALTVLTLNGFNLDWHVEARERVTNPQLDIDDDWGDGRFHTLAQAIVLQANTPDIIALQEIQDNDGAEVTDVVDATKTYTALAHLVSVLSGVQYQWVDIPPVVGADGGQPGGNIRNGYLYNPGRAELVAGSVTLLGGDDPSFLDSRKPLAATFRERASGQEVTLINVHLVSKRQQQSIFAPQNPGVDTREAIRVQQAEVIRSHTKQLHEQSRLYYITGDFNDHEHSATLATLVGQENTNLVMTLPPEGRYDYNHRGKLQVLMHGILPTHLVEQNQVAYDIIHGNELLGVEPGLNTSKPSDHAYVLAKLLLR